jgi:hypothetical protein
MAEEAPPVELPPVRQKRAGMSSGLKVITVSQLVPSYRSTQQKLLHCLALFQLSKRAVRQDIFAHFNTIASNSAG